MFERFTRSWDVTKLTFSVISKDRELLLYPMFAGIFSTIFMIVMAIPSILPAIFAKDDSFSIMNIITIISIFIIYFGLAFIATYFNVCVVYTCKKRFEGANASFLDSIQFASSKLHLIFAWSLLSATVGMILKIVDSFAENVGGIGELIIRGIISLIGLAWSIATIFVVPSMVYNDLGPIDAVKESVAVIKKTWGESLIRHYGLGLIQTLVVLAGMIIIIPIGLLITVVTMGFGVVILIAMVVIYCVLVFLVFSVANTIFNTALFVYASEGQIPTGYNEEILSGAFRAKEEKKKILKW